MIRGQRIFGSHITPIAQTTNQQYSSNIIVKKNFSITESIRNVKHKNYRLLSLENTKFQDVIEAIVGLCLSHSNATSTLYFVRVDFVSQIVYIYHNSLLQNFSLFQVPRVKMMRWCDVHAIKITCN